MIELLMKLATTAAMAGSLAAGAAPPKAIDVTLNFGRYGLQIEGPESASVCQFHGSDPIKNTVGAARSY